MWDKMGPTLSNIIQYERRHKTIGTCQPNVTREHLSKVGNVFTVMERMTFPASRTILGTIRIVLCSVPSEPSGVWGDVLKERPGETQTRGYQMCSEGRPQARGKPKKGEYRKYTTSVLFFSATKKDSKYLSVFRRRGNVQDVPKAWRQ